MAYNTLLPLCFLFLREYEPTGFPPMTALWNPHPLRRSARDHFVLFLQELCMLLKLAVHYCCQGKTLDGHVKVNMVIHRKSVFSLIMIIIIHPIDDTYLNCMKFLWHNSIPIALVAMGRRSPCSWSGIFIGFPFSCVESWEESKHFFLLIYLPTM